MCALLRSSLGGFSTECVLSATELRVIARLFLRSAVCGRESEGKIALQQPPRARLDLSVLNAGEQGQLLGLLRKVMSERPIAPVVSGIVVRD